MAFLRGRALTQVETIARTQPQWDRVEALVKKYGESDPRDAAQRLLAWRAEAGR